MSDLRRLDGERVFCHQCSNEWDRAQGGLTCPRCEGEFVEIVGEVFSESGTGADGQQLSGNDTRSEDEDLFPGQTAASPPRHRSAFDHPSPQPDHDPLRDPFRTRSPLDHHNPWADVPDPDEGDISTFQFSTPGGGRGTFSFTSRTYTTRGSPFGQRGMNGPDMFPFGPMSAFGTAGTGGMGGFQTGPTHRGPQPADMQDLFSIIMQSMQAAQAGNDDSNGARTRGGFFVSGGNLGGNNRPPPNPLSLIAALLRPGATPGQHGDMVWSQEAFDRIVEQLAEQGNNAPPPASEEAIKNLPKKRMTRDMMGDDDKAECSICMDTVELNAEVTTLPCNHWFHEECVVAWLKEHNTCPHCRKPISGSDETPNQASGSRRRPSRRSSSVGSPFGGEPERNGQRVNSWTTPDSPSNVREARMRYYGRANPERDRAEMRRSDSPRRPDQAEQYYGGRHESTDYYSGRPDSNRRHSGRRHSRTEAQSSTGGGVTGWIRNHLPGGGGSR